MTIDLQTLKCGECGSSVLQRAGLNQYTCAHCGSMSVVEDDVSDRLERVLEQVKNEAGRRLAIEQSARSKSMARMIALGAAAVVVLVTGFFGVMAYVIDRNQPAGAYRPGGASTAQRTIPSEGLKLEARQVLVGNGSSAKPQLLVIARNETGTALERPNVKAIFFDRDSRIGENSESVPIGTLMPGEMVPVLVKLPGDGTLTRQELQVDALSAPYWKIEGPPLQFTRVRLVQQDGETWLFGRLVNARKDEMALVGIEVLVTLYDGAGTVIGFGRGFSQASEIRPGERSAAEVRIERLGDRKVPVAAWDYRIDYNLTAGAQQVRNRVLSSNRVIRTTGAPEALPPSPQMSSQALLADVAGR
ncbi:hypothetical protein SAMN05518669_12188 [Variovorax sp. YR634]|uniref:hypothetical protein n=1 Tax=Variovorax sp. YR634 TaxID=1884385 RepID=UPI0008999B67|nr:hypothetical protein [Variovorax sp. YR634]SDZ11217.1 hypothetical protein SAMN05518669_12188 [Variovorax sp. YR634]